MQASDLTRTTCDGSDGSSRIAARMKTGSTQVGQLAVSGCGTCEKLAVATGCRHAVLLSRFLNQTIISLLWKKIVHSWEGHLSSLLSPCQLFDNIPLYDTGRHSLLSLPIHKHQFPRNQRCKPCGRHTILTCASITCHKTSALLCYAFLYFIPTRLSNLQNLLQLAREAQ